MKRHVDILIVCLLMLVGWFFEATYDVKLQPERVTCVRISPSGRLLARASDEPLTVFDLNTGDVIASFERAFRAEFSPDDRLLAAVHRAGIVSLFDLATGNKLAKLNTEQGTIQWLRFSPDSTKLATSGWHRGEKHTVKVWDIRKEKLLFNLAEHGGSGDLAFSPDGTLMATVGTDRSTQTTTIIIWDSVSGDIVNTFVYDNYKYISTPYLSFSRDGDRLLLDKGIVDIDSGEWIARFAGTSDGRRRCGGNGETNLWISGNWPVTTVSMTEIQSKATLWTIRSDLGRYRDVRFEPATGQLTLAGQEGTVEVWDTTGPKRIKQMTGLTLRRFRPQWYVIGGLVIIWSIAWIRLRGKLRKHAEDAVERRLMLSWWPVSSVVALLTAQVSVLVWTVYWSGPINFLTWLSGWWWSQLLAVIALLVVAFTMRVRMTSVVACFLILLGTTWWFYELLHEIVASME